MNEETINTVVIVACGLVWLIALVAGIWRVRHQQDRRGLILTVLGLVAFAVLIVSYLGSGLGPKMDSLRQAFGPKPAVIVIPWTGRGELQYRRDSRSDEAQGQNGRYTVPSGTLELSQFIAYSAPDTTAWEARTQITRMHPVTLAPGQEMTLPLGPPYTSHVEDDRNLKRLVLKTVDAGGNSTTITDPERQLPPGFELLDKQGKAVWRGKFAYG